MLFEISLKEDVGKNHYLSKPVKQEGKLLTKKLHPLDTESIYFIWMCLWTGRHRRLYILLTNYVFQVRGCNKYSYCLASGPILSCVPVKRENWAHSAPSFYTRMYVHDEVRNVFSCAWTAATMLWALSDAVKSLDLYWIFYSICWDSPLKPLISEWHDYVKTWLSFKRKRRAS